MNGKTGDPIIAPLKGRVVLIGDFFYTGNTVILSHGEGLYTSYAHMDEITTDLGKIIQQGNIRPIRLDTGLLVFLDKLKRKRFLKEWNEAIFQ